MGIIETHFGTASAERKKAISLLKKLNSKNGLWRHVEVGDLVVNERSYLKTNVGFKFEVSRIDWVHERSVLSVKYASSVFGDRFPAKNLKFVELPERLIDLATENVKNGNHILKQSTRVDKKD